jgi:hypothetical protein
VVTFFILSIKVLVNAILFNDECFESNCYDIMKLDDAELIKVFALKI